LHHLTEVSTSVLADFKPGEVIATSTAAESVLPQVLNHLLRMSSNDAFLFLSRAQHLYTVFFNKTALKGHN